MVNIEGNFPKYLLRLLLCSTVSVSWRQQRSGKLNLFERTAPSSGKHGHGNVSWGWYVSRLQEIRNGVNPAEISLILEVAELKLIANCLSSRYEEMIEQ